MTNTGTAQAIAQRVRRAADREGLTVNGLADRAGIPYPTLRRRLNFSAHLFTVDELARISAATRSDFAYLVAGHEDARA